MEQQQIMLPVKNVRFARSTDVPGGNLIARRGAQKIELGLRITETADGPRGVLWLRASSVVFERTDLDCLDLWKPIFLWTPGEQDSFVSQGNRLTPGQLVVQSDSVLIMGTDGSTMPREPLAWNVETGIRAFPDTSRAALLHEWSLGVRGVNDRFVELLDFPKGRSFFG